jgi:hypothetical protein
MFKNLFAVVSYAAADDKLTAPGSFFQGSAATRLFGNKSASTTNFKNGLFQLGVPFNDAVCGRKEIQCITVRETPVGDADYAGLDIGSLALQFVVTATAVTDFNIYIKRGTGAYDWAKIATAIGSTSSTTRTVATNEIDIRGTNSGTGDYRAVYGKIELTHASAGSGDALRGYAVAKGGVDALRGAHLTAEIGAGGSVVGMASGATCQFSTVAGLTLNAGTASALNLVSDLSSAVSGMTSASFIRVDELKSAKIPYLFDISASATGCVGATTGSTAAGTLKIIVAGVAKFIQLYATAA